LVLVSQPDPDLGGNVSICEGESYTFDLTGQFTFYEWHDLSHNPTYTTSTGGEVSVKVSDEYGCSAYDTAIVSLYNNPSVNLGRDTVLCGDNALLLDAGDFASYDWSTGEIVNPITVREGAGLVSVTVTDDHGCQAFDEIRIGECNPENLLGVIPNAFTPNQDNVHDSWEIKNIYLFPDADIQVFDRWGRIVYRSDGGYENDWYGTGLNGNELPVDTYYYIIDLKVDGFDPISGTVTIIR
jgi:gliding motility-associated-like protein